ncbi:hypothetical protein N7450_010179 [Penicillium hetheringtonii]|uniref:Uncharacterized protein n=1 Tax=Penicillium hetheringtonii TaxID=911720 RepID=A0AAD6DEF0_9EURO|nr:hypothetical protein N7450_010179 [Penicillium hetheringtonii]
MEKRQDSSKAFKVVLLGDRNTSLAKWCQSEEYTDKYSQSHRPSMYHLLIDTNRDSIKFDIWDMPGEIDPSDTLKEHVDDADAAILMFDLQSPSTLDSIPLWYDKLPTERGNFPVALCGNKTDLPYRRLGPGSITFHREKGLQYNDISVKEGYNLIRPFLFLAKRILHDPSLELEQAKAEADPISPQHSALLHLEPAELLSTRGGRSLLTQRQYNAEDRDSPPSKGPRAFHADGHSLHSTEREEFDSSICIPPETAIDSDIQRRLKRMVLTLQQHPHIRVTEARLDPPTPQSEIDRAKEYARGILPDGVEEFYSQVGSFALEWEHTSPELTIGDLPCTGRIKILPINETFGDNWRDITWFPLPDHIVPRPDDEWRFTYRGVLPFDFFVPEACMCFIQTPGGIPENHIAYHYFGEELYRTRYTFKDYIERLLASYGFWYWEETLCSETKSSAQVLSFRANMPQIFEGYDDGLFQP